MFLVAETARSISIRSKPESEPLGHGRIARRPAINAGKFRPATAGRELEMRIGLVANSGAAVIGDVNVQISIAVDVRQRHRHAGSAPIHFFSGPKLLEPAFAVIEIKMGSLANRIDDQIEITVSIDVGQHRPGRIQSRTGDTGRGRDVLELPVAEIPVEGIGSIQTAKVEIATSVAINVPGRHARAVEIDLIGQMARRRENVCEINPS
jgi:hypothetical protein